MNRKTLINIPLSLLLLLTTSLFAQTNISGVISASTTWTKANAPYIITGNTLIAQGQTLTIEPGVAVKFNQGMYMKVEGFINAAGDKDNKIIFTSNLPSPARGSWEGIQIRPTGGTTFDNSLGYLSGSNFQNVQVQYANKGIYVYSAGIRLNAIDFQNNNTCIEIRSTNKAVIESCNFNNNSTGIYSEYDVNTGDGVGAIKNTFIRNNSFNSNNFGVSLISNQQNFENLNISNNTFLNNSTAISFGGGGYGPRVHSVYINNNLCQQNINAIMINQIYGLASPTTGIPEYPLQIFENTILNNSNSSISIYSPNVKGIVRNNIINNNKNGIEIYGITYNGMLLQKNSLINNEFGVKIGMVYSYSSSNNPSAITFSNNSFYRSKSDTLINIAAASGVIFNNNNFNSIKSIILNNRTTNTVNAQNNYWGTNNTDSIRLKIYDQEDNFELGKVTYTPNATGVVNDAPLSMPANVYKSSGTNGGVSVNWSKNTENSVVGYKVYWGFDSIAYTFLNSAATTDTFYTVNSANLNDIIAVTARNANATTLANNQLTGNESWYSFAGLNTPPTGLIVKAGTKKAALSWNAVKAGNSVNIYRKTGDNSLQSIALNITASTFTDVGLNPFTTYSYAIKQVTDGNTESSFSDTVTVRPDRFFWVGTNGSNSNTGSQDFPLLTIKNAIDNAATGDTIILKPGVFKENITVPTSKSLTIASQYLLNSDSNYIKDTRLDGSNYVNMQNAFISTGSDNSIYAPLNTFDGLTVQNVPGQIFQLNRVLLKKLIITNNTYPGSYASLAQFNNSTLDSCVFRKNGLTNPYYDGIYLRNSVIKNCLFENTKITDRLIILETGENTVENSKFYGNGTPAVNKNSAVLSANANSGKNRLRNNEILNNSGTAINLSSYFDSIVIANNTIYGNYSAVAIQPNNLYSLGTDSKVYLNNNIMAGSKYSDFNISSYSPSKPLIVLKNNVLGFSFSGLSSYANISNLDTTGSSNNYGFYPEFRDTAYNDFRLSNISPAINKGTAELAPAYDLIGNPRPSPAGSNPDLGAYENAAKYAGPKLTSITAGSQKATLNWVISSTQGLVNYKIFRSTSTINDEATSGFITDTIGIAATKYTDSGLTNLTKYYYRIKAADASGVETGLSNEIAVTPNIPPPAPDSLIVKKGPRNLKLGWNAVTGGKIKFQVFKGTSSSNKGLIADTLTITSFTDNAVAAGVTYFYSVRAIDSSGILSDYSAEASGQAERIFWVDTRGSNNNSGSFDSPLRNIQYAISKALDSDTIIMKPGAYVETVSFSKTKAVTLSSQYLLNKDTGFINNTSIEGSSTVTNSNGFFSDTSANYNSGTSRHLLQGVTIQKASGVLFNLSYTDLKNVVIKNNVDNSGNGGFGSFTNSTLDSCKFLSNGSQTYSYYFPLSLNNTTVNHCTINNNRIHNLFSLNLGSSIDNSRFYDNGIPSSANSDVIISLANSGKSKITNSEFIKNYGIVIQLDYYIDSTVLANNTFFGNQMAIKDTSSSYGKVFLNNNLIAGSKYSEFRFAPHYSTKPVMVFKNNVIGYNFTNLAQLSGSSYIDTTGSQNNYSFYPDFIDSANNNFHLSSTSPAINKGTVLLAPAFDLAGISRPLPAGSNPDIGAYETPYNLAAPKLIEPESGDKKIILKWSTSSTTGVNRFALYRSFAPISDTTTTGLITDTLAASSTQFIDSAVTNLSRYYYRIKAITSEDLKSGLSNEVSAIPNVKPAAPANLVVSNSPDRNRLDWRKVTAGSPVTYQLLRRTSTAASATLIAKNITDSIYVDSVINRGQKYYYTVKAADTTGATGAASTEVSSTPASIWFVDNAGSNSGYSIGSFEYPFQTIEFAHNKLINNDTLILKPGEYKQILQSYKFITIGSMYLLTGRKGSIDSTIINGAGLNQDIFTQSGFGGGANRFRIQGLTVKNAQQSAVLLSKGGELKNMVFTGNGNGSSYYPLVSAFYDDITIENCTFENNKSNGIISTAYNSSSFKIPIAIRNCIIRNNYLPSLAALSLNTAAKVSNVLIAKNQGIAKAVSFWPQASTASNTTDSIWINHVTLTNNSNSNITFSGHKNSYLKIVNSIVSYPGVTTNIIFNSLNTTFAASEKPKVILRNNLISNGIPSFNTAYFDTTGSANTYTFEPNFNDTSAVSDFSLSKGSSAIGKGINDANNPAFDLNNRNRPLPAGSNPDIGAYEDSLAIQAPATLITSVWAGNKRDTITWVQLPDTSSIARFKLYRSTSPNASKLVSDSIPKSATRYVDSIGLQNAATYYYRLRAVDSLGQEFDYSNEKSAQPFNKRPKAGVLNNVYTNVNRTYETPIYMSNSGSTDSDGKIDSTAWFINDVRAAVGSIVQLKVKQGNNKISYVVYDNDGATDTATCTHSYYATKVTLTSGSSAGISAFNKNNLLYSDILNNLNSIIRVDSLLAPNYSGGPSQLVVNNPILTSPSVTPDSIMFIPNGSSIDAFKINGTPWFGSSAILSSTVQVLPTIDTALKRIYAGLSNGILQAVSYGSSTPSYPWNFNTKGTGFSSPGVITSDRKLVFTTTSGSIKGFDLNTLNESNPVLKWDYNVGFEVKKPMAIDAFGNIVIVDESGTVRKLRLETDGTVTVLWSKKVSAEVVSTSVVIDGANNIYAGTNSGQLVKLNSATGDTIWTYKTNGAVRYSPALSNYGRVYFGNDAGEVYSVNTETGAREWFFTPQTPAAISSHLLHIAGATYFTTGVTKEIYQVFDKPSDVAFSSRSFTSVSSTGAVTGPTKISEPVWGMFQGDYRRTGQSIATKVVTVFTFTGNGNWSDPANWENNTVPPYTLTAGYEVRINPAGDGECVADQPVIVKEGALLDVKPGKKIRFTVK